MQSLRENLITDRAIFLDLLNHYQGMDTSTYPPALQKLMTAYITLLRDGMSLLISLVYYCESNEG